MKPLEKKKVKLGVSDAKVHITSCHGNFVMIFRDLTSISLVYSAYELSAAQHQKRT